MTPLFVDTGAWYAVYSQRDGHHAAAEAAWRSLSASRLVTSSLVLVELARLMERFSGGRAASIALRRLYQWDSLMVLRPDLDVELAALDLLEKYADARIGFVDCISFVLMRRQRIERAFTFDRHFAIAGFEPWPAPAPRG